MNRLYFSFVLVLIAALTSIAFADPPTAPIPGVNGGHVVSVEAIRTCMAECSVIHRVCVSANNLEHCIHGTDAQGHPIVPSCARLSQDSANALSVFCDACGAATHGCQAVTRTHHPSRARTHAVQHAVATHPLADAAVIVAIVDASAPVAIAESDASVVPIVAEEPSPTLDPATECAAHHGRWDANYHVPVRDESNRLIQEFVGVCWTSEGEAMMQRLDAMHHHLSQVEQIATNALERAERSITVTDAHMWSVASDAITPAIAVEHDARVSSERDILVTQQAQSLRLNAIEQVVRHPPSTFGMRLHAFAGMGLVRLWNASDAPVPAFVGGEFCWDPSVGEPWIAEVGLGVGYAGPNTGNITHIEMLLHGGMIWRRIDHLGIGFGAILMNRLTDTFNASHVLGGGYGELTLYLDQYGWSPTISVRGVLGAGYRFTSQGNLLDVDGSGMIMLGIQHLAERVIIDAP